MGLSYSLRNNRERKCFSHLAAYFASVEQERLKARLEISTQTRN